MEQSKEPSQLQIEVMRGDAWKMRLRMREFRQLLVEKTPAFVLEDYDSFCNNIDVILKTVFEGKAEPFDKVPPSKGVGWFVFCLFPWIIGVAAIANQFLK